LLEELAVEIGAQHRVIEELSGRIERWRSEAFVEALGVLGPEGVKRFEAARAFVALLCVVAQHVDDSSDLRHIRRGTHMAAGAVFPWGDLPLGVPAVRRNGKTSAALGKIMAALSADPKAKVEIDAEYLLMLVADDLSRGESAAIEVAPVSSAPSVGILKRAASVVGLGQAAKPVAQKPAEPQPEPVAYTFADYHDVVH
jgi:hypothetical protein